MKRIDLLIVLVGVLVVCNSCRSGLEVTEKIRVNYEEAKQLYPVELIDHLPDLEDGLLVSYELAYPYEQWGSIGIMMIYDKERVKEIEQDAKKNSVAQYHFTDKCLMVVHGDYMQNKKYRRPLAALEGCPEELLPIADFDFVYNCTFLNRFYKKANIYVLEADTVKLFEEDMLSRIQPSGLTEKWRHGYSRGIAVADDVVAYWLQSW